MPVYLRVGSYKIYFWSNENNEPVHFHITPGHPGSNDTKVWITKNGNLRLAHNKSRIPERDLFRIMIVMKGYVKDFLADWQNYFGYVKYIDG